MTVIVEMRHIRAANLCASGARRWFASRGLPWQDFLDNGIDADFLDTLDDELADQVSAIARREVADGGQ